jgi:hypothetical protein
MLAAHGHARRLQRWLVSAGRISSGAFRTFKSQNSQLERNSPIKCHDRHFKHGDWHELGRACIQTSPVRHIRDPERGLANARIAGVFARL